MARSWSAAAISASLLAAVFGGCGSTGAGAPSAAGAVIGTARPVAPPAGDVELTYRAIGTARARVDTASLEFAVATMRGRLAALGSAGQARVGRVPRSADEIRLMLPSARDAAMLRQQIGRTASLHFYDWETNVIGPDGKPVRTFPSSATGGIEAGSVADGLLEYDAVLRAARRTAIPRPTDTTLQHGCTAAQVDGCVYGEWYLLDTRRQRMLCPGGGPVCPPRNTERELYADGYRPPAGARAVRVNPGTVLVQAHPEERSGRFPGQVANPSPNSFYVLNDAPSLGGAEIYGAQQSFQEDPPGASNVLPALRPSGRGAPDVLFALRPSGREAFERLTREIARRGEDNQLTGVSKEAAEQHFAIVLDGQILTAPSIDYTRYPEGIDARNGSEIVGGLTVASARGLAVDLNSGALPVQLELISERRVR